MSKHISIEEYNTIEVGDTVVLKRDISVDDPFYGFILWVIREWGDEWKVTSIHESVGHEMRVQASPTGFSLGPKQESRIPQGAIQKVIKRKQGPKQRRLAAMNPDNHQSPKMLTEATQNASQYGVSYVVDAPRPNKACTVCIAANPGGKPHYITSTEEMVLVDTFDTPFYAQGKGEWFPLELLPDEAFADLDSIERGQRKVKIRVSIENLDWA